jgi:hypothetical protein
MRELLENALKSGYVTPGYSLVFGIKMNKEMNSIVYCDDCVYQSELWEECQEFMRTNFPDFLWNQIYIHPNYSAKPHKDCHVIGNVLVVAFGDFEGGELVIDDVPYVTKDKVTYFEGSKLEHWNKPITKGMKFSFCCITDGRCPVYNE